MQRLELSEIASAAFSASGIGEKNTVSNGPDDGANPCQANHWWRVMRHGSTAEAVSNILNAPLISFDPPAPALEIAPGLASTGAANIVGHGNEGQLETGMGQTGPFDNAKIILNWNEWAWGPELDKIKTSGVTYVSIWACHPGAGPDGAEFVYRLAKRCDRAVRAGTGFLYCNRQKIWWENGSVWQVGTPNHKPDPIAAPTPHFLTMAVQLEDGEEIVGAESVVSVRIDQRVRLRDAVGTMNFDEREAPWFVEQLFRSEPIDLSDVGIPAMVTAMLAVRFKSGGEETFTVYNDRLARNQRTGTAYYIGSVAKLQVG